MTRPMVWIGSAFLVTAFAVSFLHLPGIFLLALLLSLCLIPLLFRKKFPKRAPALALLCSALVACLRIGLPALLAPPADVAANAGSSFSLTGEVREVVHTADGKLRYRVHITDHDLSSMPARFNAYWYTSVEEEAACGDWLTGTAKCLPMESTADFAAEAYYREQGISAVFFSYTPPSVTGHRESVRSLLANLRASLEEGIDGTLPSPASALTKAILLGDDSAISERITRAFAVAGILHLFCVSGLHVTLFAGMFSLLTRKWPRRWRVVVSLLAVWSFVGLTGFGIPAVRAGVMMTVLLVGQWSYRPADALNSLFLAGTLIVLVHPAAVSGGSFLLSFCATFGVLFLGPAIESRGKHHNGFTRALAGSVGALLAILPVSAWLYRGISLLSPISNLIALPLAPLLLCCGIGLLLTLPVPFLAGFFGFLLELLFGALLRLAKLAEALPVAYVGLNFRVVSLWMPVFFVTLIACLLLQKRRYLLRVLCMDLGVLVIAAAVTAFSMRDRTRVEIVRSFDASCVVFSRGADAAVVTFDDDKSLDIRVEEYLRSVNVKHIRTLLIGGANTAWSGDTAYLADSIPVDLLFLREENELAGYAENLLHPAQMLFLSPKETVQITGKFPMQIDCEAEALTAMLSLNGKQVAVSDGDFAGECEIWIFAGENLTKPAQNAAKYVILLKEPGASLPKPLYI